MKIGGVTGNSGVSNNVGNVDVKSKRVESQKMPKMEKVKNEERLKIKENVQPDSKLDDDRLKEMVESINKITESVNHQLKFELKSDFDQPIVKIVDKRNGKIIKEIPPEEFLKMVEKMKDFIGALFDEKA